MKKIILWTLSFWLCGVAYGSDITDSLQTVLKKVRGAEKLRVLTALSNAYLPDSFDLSLNYIRQAQNVAEDLPDSALLAETLIREGYLWEFYAHEIREARNAIMPYKMANKICMGLEDTACMALTSFYTARVYTRFEFHERALPNFLTAIELFRLLGDTTNLVMANLTIAQIYRKRGEPENAIFYCAEALSLAEGAGLDSLRPLILFNVGDAHLEREEFQVALAYLDEAISMFDLFQDIAYKVNILNRAGETHCKLDELTPCLEYHRKALSLSRDNNDLFGIADSYTGLAGYHIANFNMDIAQAYLDSSSQICRKIGFKSKLLENYEKYISVFLQTEEYVQSMRYQKQYEELRDSIEGKKEKEILAKTRAFSEAERMEYELQILNKEKAVRDAELKTQSIQIQFVVIVAMFMAILLAIFFFQFQNKKKINEELEAEVSSRTQELREAYGEVVTLNEELDTFAYRTAHDIRGPVARLLGLCQVAMISNPQAEVSQYMDMIHREAINMDFMLHRFLEVNKIKELTPLRISLNLESIVDEVWNSLAEMEGFQNFKFTLKVDPELSLVTDVNLLEIVLKNIMENAVMFRNRNEGVQPRLIIEADKKHANVHIRIIDNGIGLRPEVVSRIFEMFYRGTTMSTGLGLGLYATRLAADKISANVEYRPENRNFTEFEVILPSD